MMEEERRTEQVTNEQNKEEQGSELGEADQLEQDEEPVASQPLPPSLPLPHAETVEQEEQTSPSPSMPVPPPPLPVASELEEKGVREKEET